VTLETMLVGGLGLTGLGVAELLAVVAAWAGRDFSHAAHVLPAVLGALLMTLGAQTVLGGFLMAILEGAEAGFLARASRAGARQARVPDEAVLRPAA
jgi:hypothetical protein